MVDRENTSAVIRLRGHGVTEARLHVSRYAWWAWVSRVTAAVGGWLGGTVATLLFTFDPFVASFPFVIGMGFVSRAIRGRYAVHAFDGVCPRCREPLVIKPGTKISLPFPMTCYSCHHEPELLVRG